jgi:hypothetical protein
MGQFNCYNIGTYHNSLEKTNLLVKLFDDCPALEIRGDTLEDQKFNATLYTANKADVKYINDGVGSMDPSTDIPGGNKKNPLGGLQGWGIKDKTRHTIELIKAASPTQVNLAGHSRGAILSIRIAAYLWEHYGDKVPVNLFLLDPVKFSVLGTDFYNREIHPNVKNLCVVVMEDLEDVCNTSGGFKLMTVKKRGGTVETKAKQRFDPAREYFIRMPGSHGTGSQVDGSPIGEVTFQIARRRFSKWKAPVGGGIWTDNLLCDQYFKVHDVNPLTRQDGKLVRKINDNDYKKSGNFKYNMTNSRNNRLNGKGIRNRFRKEGEYFVNEHQFNLFKQLFPAVANVVLRFRADPRLAQMFQNSPLPQRVRTEIELMRRFCPNGYRHLSRVGLV